MLDYESFVERVTIEQKEEWLKWTSKIPYVSFPGHWRISIIPPFCGAMARFRVKTDEMSNESSISIYLDCLGNLAPLDHPYWEVYPVDGDTFRCEINNITELLSAIQRGIDSSIDAVDTDTTENEG